jgi:Protein of unknown function (DUF2934)
MGKPAQIDIVRRAYELWQQAGEPQGRDEEFYHQAEKELQEALDKKHPWIRTAPYLWASDAAKFVFHQKSVGTF